jgi:hypothetical protein
MTLCVCLCGQKSSQLSPQIECVCVVCVKVLNARSGKGGATPVHGCL